MKSIVIFDVNMILRFLLNDNKEMSDITKRHLENGEVIVTIEVFVSTIKNFINFVICDKSDVLSLALDPYRTNNLFFRLFVICI